MIGQTISHYRVLGKLGGGGMGVVYKAEDTKLGRRVALKFLPEELSQDRQALERFQREARAASALNHPNICTIYDVDESEGRPFIAMELLEGQTLKHRIEGRPCRDGRAARLGESRLPTRWMPRTRRASCIGTSSRRTFSSPAAGRRRFWISAWRNSSRSGRGSRSRSERPASATAVSGEDLLTSPGTTLGTVAYMSPEQARGEELDARTDLFSFGVVLYEMATGRQPFSGSTSAVDFRRSPQPDADSADAVQS